MNGNPHANFKWDSFNFSRDESDNDVWYMYDEWHGGVDKFQGYKRFVLYFCGMNLNFI